MLDGGILPGIGELEGRVMLDSRRIENLQAGATESDDAVVGTDTNGETMVAAVVHCGRGGAAWPGKVVAWNVALDDGTTTPLAATLHRGEKSVRRAFAAAIAGSAWGEFSIVAPDSELW